MALQVGALEIVIRTELDQMVGGFNRAAAAVDQHSGRIAKSTDNATRSIAGAERSLRNFRGGDAFSSLALSALRADNDVSRLRSTLLLLPAALGGVTAAAGTRALQQYADTATQVRNRLAVVAQSQSQRLGMENEIFEIAQKTRTSYAATAQLYSRTTQAAQGLGRSQGEIAKFVETVGKTGQISGQTTQESQASAVQLAQALASNRLQGDELRSILENNVSLAQLLAKELAGGNLGKLRTMGSEGMLNAQQVIDAVLRSATAVDAQFAQTAPTIENGLVVMNNALVRYVGQMDQAVGGSQALFNLMSGLANNVPQVAAALGTAAAAATALGAFALGKRAHGAVGVVQKERADKRGEHLDSLGASVQQANRAKEEALARAQAASALQRERHAQPDKEAADTARVQSLAREEAALKAVDKAATDNLKRRIALQNELDAKAVAIGQGRRAAETIAETKALDAQVRAVQTLTAARERDAKAHDALTKGMHAAEQQQSRKGLKPLYEAAFDRDAAQDAKIAAQSRAAALQTEMSRLEAQGPSSRKKKDVASHEQELSGVRQALATAEKERANSLRIAENAERNFLSETARANAAAEKSKTSALRAELKERATALEALKTAEQNAAKATVAVAPGQDSKAVLKDIREQTRLQKELADAQAKANTIDSARALQQGAVQGAATGITSSAGVNRAAADTAAAAARTELAGATAILAREQGALTAAESHAQASSGRWAQVTSAAGAAVTAFGRSAASLVAFLGGPWGVAFAAAAGAYALMSLRSAEATQKAKEQEEALLRLADTAKRLREDQNRNTPAASADTARRAELARNISQETVADYAKRIAQNRELENLLHSPDRGLRKRVREAVGEDNFERVAVRPGQGIEAGRITSVKDDFTKDEAALGRIRDVINEINTTKKTNDALSPLLADIEALEKALPKLREVQKATQESKAFAATFGPRASESVLDEALTREAEQKAKIEQYTKSISDAKAVADAAAPSFKALTEEMTSGLTAGQGGLATGALTGNVSLLNAEMQKVLQGVLELKGATASIDSTSLRALVEQFLTGQINLERFKSGLEDLSNGDRAISAVKRNFEETAQKVDEGQTKVQQLANAIASLTGKTVIIDVVQRLSSVVAGASGAKAEDFRASEIASMNALEETQKRATEKATKDLERARLSKQDRKFRDLKEENPFASDSVLRQIANTSRSGGGRKRGGGSGGGDKSERWSPEERVFRELDDNAKLAKASLSGLAEETVKYARQARLGAEDTDKFIAAFQNGTLDQAPEKLRRIYEQLKNIKEAALTKDLKFEVSQIGRTDSEQAVQTRLRSAGLPEDSPLADTLRMSAALKETKDVFKDAASGFVSDLRAGKSIAESLLNVANKIADKFISLALDAAVSGLFKNIVGGGLFAGLFGGVGKVGAPLNILPPGIVPAAHGGADVPNFTMARTVSAGALSGAIKHHSGLGAGEYAAILERGERVLTRNQSRRTDAVVSGLSAANADRASSGGDTMIAEGHTVLNQGSTYITITGDANRSAIAEIHKKLAERDREFSRNVASVSHKANTRRISR